MEYEEVSLERELDYNLSELELSQKEKDVIKKIKKSESEKEDPLKDRLLKYSPMLNNIRSIILGMNDGLVEILGAVAGFAVALRQPLLVLVAGMIVAIAGTLSMAGGSYLSIEYEKSVYKTKTTDSAKASAFYTGLAYIIGSAFPLVPFVLGFSGYYAILLSIIITAIVLTFVSILISIVSDTSIKRRILRTLIISLGIVMVTMALGFYARNVLHINI
jgi:VIT1/CCC1 family predicted Fe2+/Mn2+ transporter